MTTPITTAAGVDRVAGDGPRQPRRKVVVGVDGSSGALGALEAARAEAALIGARLEIVWAWGDEDGPYPAPGFDAASDGGVGPAALTPVPTTSRAVAGQPGPALVAASVGADLVVVGARGASDLLHLRLGSVSSYLVDRSPVPVMVVRERAVPAEADASGPIVVGLDGSEPSRRALRWALHEAHRRGVGVIGVHGWRTPGSIVASVVPASVHGPDPREAASHQLIDAELAAVARVAPAVAREGLALDHPGGRAVVDVAAANESSLIVVGRTRDSSASRRLLGSVGHHVVETVDLPVVVVP